MNGKRKISLIGAAFLAVLFFSLWNMAAFPALAAGGREAAGEKEPPKRVYDQAGLFTVEDERNLEEEIEALREGTGVDVVLVTTDDAEGKTSEEYADDFYDQGEFGAGGNHDGVLYLMDMDNREVYLSTSGEMIRVLTDRRIEAMLDEAVAYMGRKNYAGCARRLLEMTEQYWQDGIPDGQYDYDRETGTIRRYHRIRWYEAILAAAISAFCAGSVCWTVKREYGMERGKSSGYDLGYRANARFRFSDESDTLVNSFVTQRVIARPVRTGGHVKSSGGGHRSTTHRSGGGSRHGGGGRKF